MHQQPYRAPTAAQGGLPRVEPGHERGQGGELGRPVPRGWLDDRRSDAERIDRLLGDAVLVARLKLSGFAGAEWERFAEELARYGLAVLNAWMYDRSIFGRVRKRLCAALPPLPDGEWDREDRAELAHDTVVIALNRFRDNVLVPGKWDHTKGATLKTFFIGQCLMCFANPYRSWHRHTLERRQRQVPLPDYAEQWVARGAGPEQKAVRFEELVSGLADLPDDRTRSVLVMTVMGFQQQEIARKLSITPKAVEMIIRRHRIRLARSEENRDEAS